MSIFDFLKPRRDPLAELNRDPVTRDYTRAAEIDFVEKQVSNLRLVGRDVEARTLISDLLVKLVRFWRDDISNPFHISILVEASVRLGVPEFGKETLEGLIEVTEDPSVLDQTTLYLELGSLYHQLDLSPEKEFDCYQKAAKALPPPDGKYAATRKQKAKAHYYAHLSALQIARQKDADWHLSQAEQFAPGVKFAEKTAAIKFFEESRSICTPEVDCQIARLMAKHLGSENG